MIPGVEVSDLRARVAELEAENARLAAEVARAIPRATKAGKSRLRGTGEAEEASPWEAGQGFLPRIFALRNGVGPKVEALHNAFMRFGALDDWRPEYQAARRAYVRALFGTTVESKIRKQIHATIRVTMVPNAK